MPLGARRTYRLSLVTALSLAFAYGLGVQFPFFAPLFGFLLTSAAAATRPFSSRIGGPGLHSTSTATTHTT